MKKHCVKKIFKPLINLILYCGILLIPFGVKSQETVVDQVIGVVGNHIILKSELENQYFQMIRQGMSEEEGGNKCEMFEDMLFNKLLLHQAAIDSITVTDNQVESDMDGRIRYFISQIGSEQKLEEYYGKSIDKIKEEFRITVKNQLLSRQVQSKITQGVSVTPAEVKAFFNKIPKDSLPYVNSEIEIAQLMISPVVSDAAKVEARKKLEEMRERIVSNKTSFITLATLYSEDPGSARKGGELGFVERGSFVPEFEAVAFKLKEGQVSEIIETMFGFHILELIERRGERINIRHILVTPKITGEDMREARAKLDSIRNLIISTDTLTFSEASARFSDDKETKYNGGLIVNPQNGTTRWEVDKIDPALFFAVDKLKTGEISQPVLMDLPGGKKAYRILMVKTRTEPHKANLKDDYQMLQDAALSEKQHLVTQKWIEKKLSSTFYRIADDYKSCPFETFKVN
jgi:peptidyl-prolyl cis-trans isomerase SurA